MTASKPATTRKRKPAEPTQQVAPEFPLHINLLLCVDGKVVAVVSEDGQIGAPAPGGAMTINWQVDARRVRTLLEESLGPTESGKPASKLWTPDTRIIN